LVELIFWNGISAVGVRCSATEPLRIQTTSPTGEKCIAQVIGYTTYQSKDLPRFANPPMLPTTSPTTCAVFESTRPLKA
jgi:hypothetical protein